MSDLTVLANVITFDSPTQVKKLIFKGIFDFAILPSAKAKPNEYEHLGVLTYIIGEGEIVHVINKKHEHLKEAISVALQEAISEVNR